MHETPHRSDLLTAHTGINLWVERGFSRREIIPRMQRAAARLAVYSSTAQPIPGTTAIDYPFPDDGHLVDALNEQIARYDIDVLWPQNSARHDLDAVEADVHVAATPDVLALVDDKIRFSQWLGIDDPYNAGGVEVSGSDGVATEFAKRHDEGRLTCVKPIIGVNGQGYWRLTDSPTASLLNRPEEREIHPDVYLAALSKEEAVHGPERFMVMDWLPGPEVSVDLLCWRSNPLMHAARTKIAEGVQLIQSEHPVLEHAHAIAGRLALHGIINVQYRLDSNNNWKMLEINPRPAGGSIYSDEAGFGIISDWAKLLAKEITPDDVRQHETEAMIETIRTIRVS